MYKVASDRRQMSLHHGRLADWQNGTEVQSPEDKRRNLQAAIRNLDERIQAASGAERKALGLQKLEWQQELRILGKLAKADNLDRQTLIDCFMEVAKEQLSRPMYEGVMAAAVRLHNQKRAQAEALRNRAQEIVDGIDAEQGFG